MYRVRLQMNGSASDVRTRVPPWIGVVEPLDERRCVLTVGADSYESLAALIVQAGADFTLLEPPELVQPIQAIAARLLGALAASSHH